ncbi:MAG: energy-coupled thiamine transporter ThiT [Actinomycetes bacterium]|jgi:thiamine transporter|nr:energy-coupled thiamine transporter ThiT [Actinomycetes bacterium]
MAWKRIAGSTGTASGIGTGTTGSERIRLLVQIALAVALFAVLDFMNLRLPVNIAGGSISLVMAPIVIIALLRGPAAGIVTGLLCGFLDLAFGATIIHPAQLLLDYPLTYAVVGCAGFLAPLVHNALSQGKAALGIVWIEAATVLAGIIRLIPATASGVIFFAEYAPTGQSPFVYSLLYNITYLLPSVVGVAVVSAVVVPILWHQLNRTR